MHKLSNLFSVSLTQFFLLGGYWIWWEQIQRRPILTALISAGYEMLVIVFIFGRKVWARLEDKAVQSTADRITKIWHSYAHRYKRRYKRQIGIDHCTFNVRGLGLINTFTIELEDVFVELRIAPTNLKKSNLDIIGIRELEGSFPIWHFLNATRRSHAIALAIIGAPGSGKTTLLQHVAMTLAGNQHRLFRSRPYIPIFLFLRDHVSTITQRKKLTLSQLVEEHITNKHPNLEPPQGWFERKLVYGKCMVLLDGLDEVADPQQRQLVAAWVDKQIAAYPYSRFVLSARPQGYRDAPLAKANILEVQPFNTEQVRKFIYNWYLANEIRSAGNAYNDRVRYRADEEAVDLLRRLRETPALRELTVNPLLLTMIAMVHRYHGALPGSRVELYAEICEVLLGRWRQAKGVKDRLNAAQKRVVLQPLAAHMMVHKKRDLEEREVIEVIKPIIIRVGLAVDTAPTFLSDLQASSGLFLEREPGHWSFAHLTFQEYLTAAFWLEQKDESLNWHEMVGDSWWHEVLRLYAAQGDATQVVKACLDKDNVRSLTLAADCLDEARELDPQMRLTIIERVTAGLESKDSARRDLAVRVQLSRRLKALQVVDDDCEIDKEYITYAEYQYFLYDETLKNKTNHPDHWMSSDFPLGEANHPITGIRAEDAEEFCLWLTKRQQENIHFRLPQPDEAINFPSNQQEIATICKSKSEHVLIGLAEPLIEKVVDQLEQLSDVIPITPKHLSYPLTTSAVNRETPNLLHYLNIGLTLNIDRVMATDFTHISDALVGGPLKLFIEMAFTRNLGADSVQRQLLTQTRIHALTLARTLARELTLASERALATTHAVARGSGIDISAARTIAHQRDVDHDTDTELNMLEVIKTLGPQFVGREPESINILKAKQIVESKISQVTSTVSQIRLAALNDLLNVALAKDILSGREAHRMFLLHTLESAYINLKKIEGSLPTTRWGKTMQDKLTPHFLSLSKTYWWLRIITERERGHIPAWEGIRIVRQRGIFKHK